MIVVFYFFAALLILLSVQSLRGGLEYLRFFKSELARSPSDFTPFVSIIAPCRGLDSELETNLQSLFDLDYPEYEILFVVDSGTDDAVSIIETLVKTNDKIVGKLIVAAKASDSSQKVENLREAVLYVDPRSEAFVFVDSDARPSAWWLRSIVSPLSDANVGATTGYRWFISDKPSFGSELRSAWNASIASALGPSTKSNFCWGGSMAIRRDTFEQLGMREKWAGTLSDDFAVTRAMNEASLPIVFVPQALTASLDNCTFGEMLEFTTRQMKITRVYATKLWILSFMGSALFCGVMLAAIITATASRTPNSAFFASIATLLIVSICSTGKAWLRLKAVRLVLDEYEKPLAKQAWTQNSLWILTPAIFLYNAVIAGFSRRMTWRGITYELKSPTETVIIAD